MNELSAASPVDDSETSWRRYPYVIPGADDSWFTFPAAEGDQGCDANTYFVESRLRGLSTGRELGVMAIFSAMAVRVPLLGALRADFYILSLFDLGNGDYGTTTEFDLPRPPRIRRQNRLKVARGLLDVSFETSTSSAAFITRPT